MIDIVFVQVCFTLQIIIKLLNDDIKSSLSNAVVCHEIEQLDYQN